MNIPPLVILHDELIVEVLTFLDVKSLMRMKCVCMSWKTLISDPVFIKMHLKKQSTRITHLAILSNMPKGSRECRSVPISHFLESITNSITLTDPCLKLYYKDVGGVVGSCNGLVCLQSCSFTNEYIEHSFSFWNPATRTKSEALASFRIYIKPLNNTCKFAFGYDNSSDTYKIVLLHLKTDVTTAVKVFTLGDNVWRDIDCLHVVAVDQRCCMSVRDVVYLNNSIIWFVRQLYICHLTNLTVQQFMIISLDLRTETYTQLSLPRCCDEEPRIVPNISVLMDCLCFSYDFKRTHIVIWLMKEFGVKESWTQFLKISYLNLLNDFKSYEFSFFSPPRLIPLCLSENGDTLIFAINLQYQTILYNWRDNTVKRIKTTNQISWFSATGYVESLVSTS